MHKALFAAGFAAALVVSTQLAIADRHDDGDDDRHDERENIQVGPRPFYLVDGMDDGALKSKLLSCKDEPVHRTNFSIGHRGASLQFPEHTKESYQAAARMGAGIVECDVTFTGDGTLVCRHAQNDLATTTNILLTPLASTCIKPFTPATFDASGQVLTPASAECRTSELTVQEFKSLRGKMDSFNPAARTPQEFQGGVPSWRTEVNTGRGTLMTMRESIELNERNGVKHTPELKEGDPAVIARVFGGQAQYAQRFADELRDAGVDPKDAFSQSFNVNDILYWINHTHYGRQATFLVDYDDVTNNILLFDTTGHQLVSRAEQLAFFRQLRRAGVQIVAPAMPALLGGERQPRRALAARHGPEGHGLRHHYLDVRARRPARRGVDGGLLLRLRPGGRGDQERQRHVQGARRARAPGRHPRYLLRLAGDGQLLRELHGLEVATTFSRNAE